MNAEAAGLTAGHLARNASGERIGSHGDIEEGSEKGSVVRNVVTKQ
jgi:hypothetical protein